MNFIAAVSTLLALSIISTSCTGKNAAESEAPTEGQKTERPRVVGRVATIPTGKSFVLIQAYGTWNIPTGSLLTTQGPEGRSANLKTTGEKLGQYAAADIQSGTLEIGDGVYTVVTPSEIRTPTTILEGGLPPSTPKVEDGDLALPTDSPLPTASGL